VTISGLSKTFSCTGWRLGFAIAPEQETTAIRKVHDFLTVGAPAPLQAAGAIGMAFPPDGKSVVVASHDSGLLTRIDLTEPRAVAAYDGGSGIEVLAWY